MTENSRSTDFRPELQGIRALAVVAVLMFHFKLLGVVGGFAGVDLFFVLSGFLITGMLRRTQDQPWKEALISFYSKRFWRISPALLFTLLITIIAGWFIFLPQDYSRLGLSAAYSSVFLSNLFFSGEAGYFDTASSFKPLLHTWSLAVEAQFYLLWPILFYLTRWMGEKLQTALVWIVLLVSFLAAQVFAFTDPAVSFYTMPMRLWEFATGALCTHPRAGFWMGKWRLNNSFAKIAALIIIVACFFFYDASLLWPAPNAILPVCATALLIVPDEKLRSNSSSEITTAILSWPPIVWFGKISYSLYLVHWPIVTMANTVLWPEPQMWLRVLLMVLCVPLAWLMFTFVEQPFRHSWKDWQLVKQFLVPTLFVAVIVSSSQFLQSKQGFVNRFPKELRAELSGDFALRDMKGEVKCTDDCPKLNEVDIKKKVFLWGDSHAGHFSDAIQRIAEAKGFDYSKEISGGCPPFTGIKRVNSRLALDLKCAKVNSKAMNKILADPSISTVVLAARWAMYSTTTRRGEENVGRIYMVETNFAEVSKQKSKRLFERGLRDVVAMLVENGKKVILLDQVPEFNQDAKRCRLMTSVKKIPLSHCTMPETNYNKRLRQFRSIANALAKSRSEIRFYNLRSVFCDAGTCNPFINGELAYSDNNHLFHGAAYPVLKRVLFLVKDQPNGGN